MRERTVQPRGRTSSTCVHLNCYVLLCSLTEHLINIAKGRIKSQICVYLWNNDADYTTVKEATSRIEVLNRQTRREDTWSQTWTQLDKNTDWKNRESEENTHPRRSLSHELEPVHTDIPCRHTYVIVSQHAAVNRALLPVGWLLHSLSSHNSQQFLRFTVLMGCYWLPLI